MLLEQSDSPPKTEFNGRPGTNIHDATNGDGAFAVPNL
jgi:hypothetical protein